jgi:hypothetical protein
VPVQSQEIKGGRGKEQYRVETSNGFAALENLDTEVYISRASETIAINENINISAKESVLL